MKQFQALPYCGPHPKPHVARGLIKYYNLRFYPEVGNGLYVIIHIPCACVACKLTLDKPYISIIPFKKQERYQHVTKCTYWKVLGSFKNWNIIKLSQKSTPFDPFDEIHQVVLDGISENMASLVQYGKCGTINTTDTPTNGIYVIMFT